MGIWAIPIPVFVVVLVVAVVCLVGAVWLLYQRKRLLESRKKALWLLYLFELSLQASISTLYNERVRSEGLQNACQEIINEYRGFREDVQERVKKRLVLKGIGAALSFVPGLALVDVLSDLADIGSDVEDADDKIKAAEAAFDKFSTDVGMEFADISSDDEISIALTQDEQEVFRDTFKWNINSDLKLLDASTVSSRVKDAIQNVGDSELITSGTDEDIKDVIEEILREVESCVTDALHCHQARKEQPDDNAAYSETVNPPPPK